MLGVHGEYSSAYIAIGTLRMVQGGEKKMRWFDL